MSAQRLYGIADSKGLSSTLKEIRNMLSILIFKNVMHVKSDRILKPFSRAKKYLLHV